MTGPYTRESLEALGFTGFEPVADLKAGRCKQVSPEPGVYVVLRESAEPPCFLDKSAGGWFKRRDPTVPVSTLEAGWVNGAPVLYIGKAGTSLRVRVRALVDYGLGKPVGHQGGRYLWQVEGSASFLVAWRMVDEPRAEETRLLTGFEAAHGQLPFANISH